MDIAAADPADAHTGFLPGVDAWIAGLGKVRDVVRQAVLAAQLLDVVGNQHGAAARVLDVGCGQGTQALNLARAGHNVTGLDICIDLLSRFEADLCAEPADVRARVSLCLGPGQAAPDLLQGPFDVVLCHGVLPYLEDVAPILDAISRVAAPQATLSLLVRNGHALAMRPGLQAKWDDALAAFDDRDYVNRLGLAAHSHVPQDLDHALSGAGWRRDRLYGVRVFTDHLEDDAPPSSEVLSRLLAAEHEAGRRDPYRQVAALLHLVYIRTAAA